MLGINRNKIKLSNLGLGGLEIEELFEDLTAEEQKYITKMIDFYINSGVPIKDSIKWAKQDLFSEFY